MRVLYESGIVQPGASSRPHPSLKPLIKGAHGWGAMVSVEEEAVAVSPGCYLLACFESPAASSASPRPDAFAYDFSMRQIQLHNICPYEVTNPPDHPLVAAAEWRISV